MRRTRLATLLVTLGWLCFPLALVFRTLAPAILGVALVALVAGARTPSPSIQVERKAPARVVAGAPFEVECTARDQGGAPLFVDEDVPLGARPLEREAHGRRGLATLKMRLVADDPGALRWGATRVRYQDAWGLIEGESSLSIPALTEVAADTDVIAQGRRAGKALASRSRMRDRRGTDVELEIERLREYQPGDPFRDIDWAKTSLLGRLITRELRRESTRPIVILLQASRSMRRRRRASKLASSTRAALAILAAAEHHGVHAGLVAWSERGLEAQTRLASGRGAVAGALERLSSLPEALPYEATRPLPGDAPARALLPQEREFLAASAAFAPLGVATPTESALAALARIATQPALVVAILDVEETPQLARSILSRLAHHGHRSVILAPASGAHHYARHELDDARIEELVGWRANRDEAARAAQRYQTPLLALRPDVSDDAIREVIASVR